MAYEEKRLLIEAEPENKAHRIEQPYQEMSEILNDFFNNDELNNELTMVTGEDLCKMFDICLFLGEQINEQRAHAIANGVFIAAVNRVGHEGPRKGGLEFWGSSFVCDPFGRVIVEAPEDRPVVMVVECDLKLQEETRRNWPFLRDRRIDAYGEIVERHLGSK